MLGSVTGDRQLENCTLLFPLLNLGLILLPRPGSSILASQ
jgi:hypothetical protein